MNRIIFISCRKIIFSYKHKPHRLNGPAVIYHDGSKSWYKHGVLHRIGEPAIIYSSGKKEWWKNGKLHRDDGPAIIWESLCKSWYVQGKHLYTLT